MRPKRMNLDPPISNLMWFAIMPHFFPGSNSRGGKRADIHKRVYKHAAYVEIYICAPAIFHKY